MMTMMATPQMLHTFYLDGSGGKHTEDMRMRRCGWSAVLVTSSDDSNEFRTAYYGTLGGSPQTVPRAELKAAVVAVKRF